MIRVKENYLSTINAQDYSLYWRDRDLLPVGVTNPGAKCGY